MKKKGIFGGTFDPIHIAHIYIAQEAVKQFSLEELVFVPTGNPPHKNGKVITDAILRYEMAKMSIRNYKEFSISDYEILKKGYSYTYETLQYFNSIESSKLYFITGADCLMDIYHWKNIKEIFKNCTLVVFNRPGYNIEDILVQKSKVEKEFQTEILWLDLLNLDISSTYIREKIKEGINMEYFLPSGVYNTINTLGLYR
ncbi:nicotinate-nucleotide adenylyltransferase [Clostridium amazonitimonense]|uniref:nicotinate-nucleotide adenylyltransferase n=1 Tax=Clostridium amazonitimonense TaxID=1499689 RepID=UPI000509DAA5|nr:nicotinate-nucleotide adenylyltransferase [Clostridium amazonitimonense]